MRAAILLLLAPFAVSASETRLTDPTSRYAAMMDQSPFALATVVEAPKEPTESFAANWELTGLMKVMNAQGEEKDYVSIRSRDHRLSFTLSGDEEATEDDAKGVSLHAVDRQDGSRKSSVMLKKGTELAKVEFSQEAAPAAGAQPFNAAAMNANQVRALQMQQMQAQQARVQQMQQALALGGNKPNGGAINLGAVVNVTNGAWNGQPAAGVPRPGQPNLPNNGVINNGAINLNGGQLPKPNGIVYPQPAVVNPASATVPDSTDPRRRLRVITTRQ